MISDSTGKVPESAERTLGAGDSLKGHRAQRNTLGRRTVLSDTVRMPRFILISGERV